MRAFWSLAVAMAVLGVHVAVAEELTYDDIGTPDSVYPYYTGAGFVEGGFQFSGNMDVIDLSSTSPWAVEGPAFSGNYAALNDFAGDASITQVGGGTFSFNDTYIQAWDYAFGNIVSGTITGYLNGATVGSVNYNNVTTWTDVVAGFQNVDTVVISAGGGTFLLDNTQVNGTSAVPEPSSFALLGLGGIGLAIGAYRRRRAAAV